MKYHWIEWDTWDGRTRRYAILEKEIIFEKNKKNDSVLVLQAFPNMINSLQKDIEKWNNNHGKYRDDEVWRPEVEILDEITTRTKIFKIIGNDGKLISFGHAIFELTLSVKLPK